MRFNLEHNIESLGKLKEPLLRISVKGQLAGLKDVTLDLHLRVVNSSQSTTGCIHY